MKSCEVIFDLDSQEEELKKIDFDMGDTSVGRLVTVKKKELMATTGKMSKEERDEYGVECDR